VCSSDLINNINHWNYELTAKQCFMRTMGYLASTLTFGVMYALPFMREDRKSLSDMWSGSTVLSEADFHQLFLYKSEYRESLYIKMPASQEQVQKAG
jgi:hypothetical protein